MAWRQELVARSTCNMQRGAALQIEPRTLPSPTAAAPRLRRSTAPPSTPTKLQLGAAANQRSPWATGIWVGCGDLLEQPEQPPARGSKPRAVLFETERGRHFTP